MFYSCPGLKPQNAMQRQVEEEREAMQQAQAEAQEMRSRLEAAAADLAASRAACRQAEQQAALVRVCFDSNKTAPRLSCLSRLMLDTTRLPPDLPAGRPSCEAAMVSFQLDPCLTVLITTKTHLQATSRHEENNMNS